MSQLSSVQLFPSSQTFVAPATHLPAWQLSLSVQASPSSQETALSAEGVKSQAPVLVSQASSVHGFLSSHGLLGPAVHTPAWQVSLVVHGSPSLHVAPLNGEDAQPLAGAQVSLVQGLLSSQVCSSVAPSQSLSTPSQLSGAAAAALHTGALPTDAQAAAPRQPLAASVQVACVARVTAFAVHVHAAIPVVPPGTHCLLIEPSTSVTDKQS